MKTPTVSKRSHKFDTAVQFSRSGIKLQNIKTNLLEFWQHPTLLRTDGNYHWSVHYSMSIDTKCNKKFDEIWCYINADLFMKDQKYFLIKLNTLHGYRTERKLDFDLRNAALVSEIVRESITHANLILERTVRGTEYEGFVILQPDEEELQDFADERSRLAWFPNPVTPNPEFLPKLMAEERKANFSRIDELVKWIDSYNDVYGNKLDISEHKEYYQKYREWSSLAKIMWQYKMIARNHIAYNMMNMLMNIEKGRRKHPMDENTRTFYKNMRKSFRAFTRQWKKEFEKN